MSQGRSRFAVVIFALAAGVAACIGIVGWRVILLSVEASAKDQAIRDMRAEITALKRTVPPPCRCHELDQCPICEGTGTVLDETTQKLVTCEECEGRGVVTRNFGAGGRIIPTVRNLADEANEAVIESRTILRKVDKLVDDIETGRVGLHIKGSAWRGEADVTVRRTP